MSDEKELGPSVHLVYSQEIQDRKATHILSQSASLLTIFFKFSVASLLANFLFPEAFELIAGLTAEDFPAHVLAVHPCNMKDRA